MRRLQDFPDAALRLFDRLAPPAPGSVREVYLIGICGKGMGALAELFAEAGYRVRGSDAAAYPPMSTRLAALGIPIHEGYDPAHLDAAPGDRPPIVVVVGNAATPTHPEAAAARERGLVQLSFPEALAHFFLQNRRPVVVAGTHGKTTTTGLLAHVLREAGLDPGFLVGGVMAGEEKTAALGSGAHFVVEGDEYDAAYFDKRPKMWLYRPHVAVVTSLEFDHADIYDGWDDYQDAFRHFVGLVPEEGRLVLSGDDAHVRALASEAAAPVTFYGLEEKNAVTARDARPAEGGQRFRIVAPDVEPFDVFLPLGGAINRQNALAVAAVVLGEGVAPEVLARGLSSFRGMKRRQEVRGDLAGVLVVDDFAHHPTAVAGTLAAVRERWPGRRAIAVFEPRSNSSRRKVFEERYGAAFDAADRVLLSAPPLRHNDDPADFLDPEAVVATIRQRGVPAQAFPSADALLPALLDALRPGDPGSSPGQALALVMSNGSFDGLVEKLLAALAAREKVAAR